MLWEVLLFHTQFLIKFSATESRVNPFDFKQIFNQMFSNGDCKGDFRAVQSLLAFVCRPKSKVATRNLGVVKTETKVLKSKVDSRQNIKGFNPY